MTNRNELVHKISRTLKSFLYGAFWRMNTSDSSEGESREKNTREVGKDGKGDGEAK